MSFEEVRQAVREYAESITRVDMSLATLKAQLIQVREHDLRLLKQLIQIGDSIRKLSRSHDRHGRKRNSHRSTQEFMTSAADLSVTLRRFKGRSGSLLGGEYNTVPLVRRQSEPQVCTLGAHCDITGDVRSWSSRRGSASSTDWWSEDALESSEDGLDTSYSDDNLDTTTASSVTINATDTSSDPKEPPPVTSIDLKAPPSVIANTAPHQLMPDQLHRPKSHSVVASTFLSRSSLSGGNSGYSDILNQNVRIWKNRLEHAQSVRQKVSILEEEP